MKKVAILLASFLTLAFASCKKINGDGPVVNETRAITGFRSIHSGISGDVYFTQDSVYGVEIRAQQNILDIIDTRVSNGELKIDFSHNHNVGRHDRIAIYVAAPDIDALTLSGSGTMTASRGIRTGNLSLRISGSGTMQLQDVTAGNVSCRISGSGDISIGAGKAQNEAVEISGSGSVDALNMEAADVTTQTTGSGTTRIFATDKLNVRISGSGNVIYKGHPQVTTSISGSGKLQPW